MSKLFVALAIPETIVEQLKRIVLPAAAGVRCVPLDQLHLTLHYVGEAELTRAIGALEAVTAPPIELTLNGVGQFPSQGGSTTLWARVAENPGLIQLHFAIGTALGRAGFSIEERRYTPHVTLGRCEPSVPPRVIEQFVARNTEWSSPSARVIQFAIYSSMGSQAPTYTEERTFLLVDGP